mmetsp:Transcript_17112/g.37350  ORF Transcript_17112/g.37350 Transcript_17112/m.37350 type:complete len:91 (+) Transcript_17112:720-992(+)
MRVLERGMVAKFLLGLLRVVERPKLVNCIEVTSRRFSLNFRIQLLVKYCTQICTDSGQTGEYPVASHIYTDIAEYAGMTVTTENVPWCSF